MDKTTMEGFFTYQDGYNYAHRCSAVERSRKHPPCMDRTGAFDRGWNAARNVVVTKPAKLLNLRDFVVVGGHKGLVTKLDQTQGSSIIDLSIDDWDLSVFEDQEIKIARS